MLNTLCSQLDPVFACPWEKSPSTSCSDRFDLVSVRELFGIVVIFPQLNLYSPLAFDFAGLGLSGFDFAGFSFDRFDTARSGFVASNFMTYSFSVPQACFTHKQVFEKARVSLSRFLVLPKFFVQIVVKTMALFGAFGLQECLEHITEDIPHFRVSRLLPHLMTSIWSA